jgi:hypothetical protein
LQDRDKCFVSVNIEDREQKFEVDSSAGFNNSTVAFRSYTGNVILPDGNVEVNVEYQGRTSREELYVVAEEYDALKRRIWIRHLGISLQ